jgi:predicted transcriptional regulator of viral defense system
MKWIEIDNKLKASKIKVFSSRDFQAVARVSDVTAKFMLIRYTKKGFLLKLKRGLYISTNRTPSPWAIANQLYKPSYLSLESALSYYGLIPESIFSVTSVTTKTTREFEAGDHLYTYRTIKRQAFGGYRSVEISGEPILIAEREKAVADYLYFVFLKRASLNERLSLAGIKIRKLQNYLRAFGKPGLLDWYRHDFKVSDRRIAR